MMRMLSVKSFGELLIKLLVVGVLTAMLAQAVQRVYSAGLRSAAVPAGSASLHAAQHTSIP